MEVAVIICTYIDTPGITTMDDMTAKYILGCVKGTLHEGASIDDVENYNISSSGWIPRMPSPTVLDPLGDMHSNICLIVLLYSLELCCVRDFQ